MKALVIKPKDDAELKFLSALLKKLGVGSTRVALEDLEDAGLAKLMRQADKSKKVDRSEIMNKLSA